MAFRAEQTYVNLPVKDLEQSKQFFQQVDDIADKALAAGGQAFMEPADHGYMYARGFQDPDGHMWEVLYMGPAAASQA